MIVVDSSAEEHECADARSGAPGRRGGPVDERQRPSMFHSVADPSPPAQCDLLVVGSGAGGLPAAVTAAWHGLTKVIVAEKEAVFGSTTAWSGGWMWTPGNPLAQQAAGTPAEDCRSEMLRASFLPIFI